MVPGTMLQRMQTSLKNQKPKKISKNAKHFFLFALSLKMPKYQPHLLQFRFGVRNKLLNVRKHAPVFEIPLDEPFRGKKPSQQTTC
jgi:hypothetical protein